MIKKFYLFIYYLFLKNLPSSYFPLGKLFNGLRVLILRRIFPIGQNTKLQSGIYVGNGKDIQIGSFSRINENVKLDNVKIGDYVMIAPGVTILGKMHNTESLSTPMVLQGEKKFEQTIISDNVWIGTNAVILPGLNIESGCIIAAGAVLTKNTQVNGVYAGIPAKLIKIRS
jgi:maltose O-acetyltransferase